MVWIKIALYCNIIYFVLTLTVVTNIRRYNPVSGVCIQPSGYHYVVIFPNSNHRPSNISCICPQWRQISHCSCVQGQTDFIVFNKLGSAGIEICWINITNNTIIHFGVEEIVPNNVGFPIFHLQFVLSYNTMMEGKQ